MQILEGVNCLKPSASLDNTLLDLHNSLYHTQPRPIIANYTYLNNYIEFKAVQAKLSDFWLIYSNLRLISVLKLAFRADVLVEERVTSPKSVCVGGYSCGRQKEPAILISTLLLQTHARQLYSLALTRFC